jgi:hypothetical protein
LKKRSFHFYIALALSPVFELLALWLLWTGYPAYRSFSIPLVLAFHLLAAVMAAVAVWLYSPLTRKAALFSFVYILAAPFLGYYSLVQLLARSEKQISPSGLFTEYSAHIKSGFHRESPAVQAPKKSLTYLKEGFEIEPLSSSLENADSRVKLTVIKSLGRIPGPDTVRALRNMLDDTHMDVRYYAGEEIARVSEFFSTLITEARKEIANRPDDAALYCELASLHLKHSLSGLFDENSMAPELQNAKEALERSLQLKGVQFDARYLSGRLFMELKEYDKALEYLESARAIKENDVPLLVALAECYWGKKNLEKLDDCIEVLRKDIHNYRGEDKPALIEFLEGWRQQGDRQLSS